ncbi:hypothetical protein [Trichlorobacter lovleyi]|uniref:hypothetical protein n=1 Tax=Trichlorobacter lovleyi TaxID=313985 RepID=UPI00059E9B0A|nr:hypothetical protein [Trichlorobacter lovleyi]
MKFFGAVGRVRLKEQKVLCRIEWVETGAVLHGTSPFKGIGSLIILMSQKPQPLQSAYMVEVNVVDKKCQRGLTNSMPMLDCFPIWMDKVA